MSKKILILVIILISLGCVLWGIGFCLEYSVRNKIADNILEKDFPKLPALTEEYSNDYDMDIDSQTSNEGFFELPAFKNIYISVKAASVKIKHGDEFSISYQLNEEEEIITAEVKDDTLHFISKGADIGRNPSPPHYNVTLTVPQNHNFQNIEIKTSLGEIKAADLKYKDGYFVSNLGNLEFENQTAENIHCSTDAGNIELAGDAQNANIKSEVGNIYVSGKFSKDININTSLGNIDFLGEIQNSGKFKTSAGNITADVNDCSINAECDLGTVTLNGSKKGRSLKKEGENPFLKLETSMGSITINS